MKNPPCQKAWRVSGSYSVNSTNSLAVFYVEQVALNRHVMPLSRLLYLWSKLLGLSRLKLPPPAPATQLLFAASK
jgi:hypothetical protein